MPFPSVVNYGVVANPIVDSPFISTSETGGGNPIPPNAFLLLDGTPFLLLDGTDFLLL